MARVDKLLVNKYATIKEAMKIIDKGKLRTGIVIDENKKLCGMITDGDIRRGILSGETINTRVYEVMNENPVFAKTDASKGEIITLLRDEKVLGLPLVDKNKIVKDYISLSFGGSEIFSFNEGNIEGKNNIETVLIIGGGGYIGSVLVRNLLSKNYKVNVLDKFIYGKESLADISNNPNLKIIEGDTRHIEDVTEAAKDVNAVVHLAEIVGDPACALNPQTTLEINNLATKNISAVCKHFQINRLIYASSCSVYGASEGEELLTEKSPLSPVSLYAKMKIESENALKEAQDDNFLPTILRFATVFGFSHRPRFDLVVNLLTAKALKDGKITIFGGNQWRPNVHVEDVSKAIIAILEAPLEVVGGEVFNIGSEENNHTIKRLGELIKKEIPDSEVVIENKKVDTRNYRVDFSKLRNTLNIKLEKSVSEGIKEIKSALDKDLSINYTDRKYSNIKFLENISKI